MTIELTPKAVVHLSAKGPIHPGGHFPPAIRLVREAGVAPKDGTRIRAPETVAAFLSDLKDEEVEHFVVLALDSKADVIARVNLTRGLLNSSLVHPREVFRAAIACGAAGIIVAHNHPSGDPTPSAEDRTVTRQLVSAGTLLDIPVYDHVIIAGETFSSFQALDLL